MPEKLTKVKKQKHSRKHGFLKRNASATGKKLLKRQRVKGRKSI